MAGKYGSASAFCLVDGYNLIANKLKELRVKQESIIERSDGLGDSWEEHCPVGLSKVEMAQAGAFFDTTADRIHDALSGSVPATPQATARVVTLGFAGQTVGSPFVGFEGVFSTAYEVLAEVGALTKANAEYTISGALERGAILQQLEEQTADWDTKLESVDNTAMIQRSIPITSSSVDNPTTITTAAPHGLTTGDTVLIAGHAGSTPDFNGEETVTVVTTTTFTVVQNVSVGGTGGTIVKGKTNAGGTGFMQVTALAGFTGFLGSIEDSADDAAYASLIAFANVTASPAAERLTVSGAVDRYLAFVGDVTGSGTISVWAGFSRG